MEIVPTSTSNKREIGLDLLLSRKACLKQEIMDQQILISTKTQNLLTPSTFSTYLFRSFTKGLNIVDAAIIGYKIVKSIQTLYRKFK